MAIFFGHGHINVPSSLVSADTWLFRILSKSYKRKDSLKTLFVFRLSIMRHEMLNFLRNLHSYVATQVLEVSWLEFQVP
jgi:hypothetical protein